MGSYRSQCQLTTLSKTRDEGHLFEKLKWPNTDLRVQVKRLYSLLTIKESASSIPKNLEARRRLEFFTNSLFMKMPRAKPVREMLSFSVFTPYYSEVVLYIMAELLKKNEDGISILFYLQKIYPAKIEYVGALNDTENRRSQPGEWGEDTRNLSEA